MTDTRQALAALLPCPFCGNSKGLAVANENPQDLSGGYFIACPSCDASTGLRFACGEDPIPLLIEQWNRRAALSAQSVAGAVATDETGWLIEHSGEILPGAEQRAQVSWLRVQMKFNGYGAREFGFTHDANEALRFARKEDAEAVLAMHLGASPPDWYSKPFSVTEHMWPDALQPQAAPATEPSAQPVAGAVATEPSEEIQELRAQVEAWRKQCETLTNQVICCGVAARHPDATLTTRGAYAGKWNSPQAEEVRKLRAERDALLAASPQPAPSAQGEPVALPAYGQMKWDELIAAVCEAQTGNRAVGWERDPSYYVGHQPVSINMNSLNRIVSGFVERASAPSTPPPAVVEAVPLTDEQADALRRLWPAIEKAMGCLVFTAEQAGAVQADMNTIRHGIAPKAAQEKT